MEKSLTYPQEDDAPMIYCVICGAESRTMHTQRLVKYTRRRRACRGPTSHRFTTWEISEDRYRLLEAAERLERQVSRFRDDQVQAVAAE
jgi:transcriptional regulator NrdR family protein